MNAHARVVLVEAGVEDAGDVEALELRDEPKWRQLPLRAGDQHRLAHLGIDGVRQVVADHDGRQRR